MTKTTERQLADRVGGIKRMIRSLGRDLSEWEPTDLQSIDHLQTCLHILRDEVVPGLREHGYTDGQIAAALGITQQAVSKRWPGGGRYQGAAGRYRSSTTTTSQEPA